MQNVNDLNILYIVTDLIIWSAYFYIGFAIWHLIRKKRDIPFRGIFGIAAIVTFLGGLTYFADALQYIQSGVIAVAAIKTANAIISVVAVAVIIKFMPVAIAMKTPSAVAKELEEQKRIIRDEMMKGRMKLEFLQRVGEILTSTLNSCDVLGNLAKAIIPEVADWCNIYEKSDDGRTRLMVILHANDDKNRIAVDLAEKFPPLPDASFGICEVLRTGKPILHQHITDEFLQKIATTPEHLDLLREIKISSALLVPLSTREKIYGALMLGITEPGRHYDRDDLEFVREISRIAMLALDNAKLYENARENNLILEKKVNERTSELRAINKEMEAFSYSVSHDLRAPLRSIEGFSNILLKNIGDAIDPQSKEHFSRIIKASQSMNQLIDDLLKLSRLATTGVNPEFSDLSAIADSIITELKLNDPARKSEIIIQKNLRAIADKNLIRIALQNLLDNAWKYSGNREVSKIEFGQSKKNGQVVFYIKDNGVGFDMQYADRLFKSFQRLHSSAEFEGTGIGLTIVQRIIKRHNGKIWVESETGRGTTFYFMI